MNSDVIVIGGGLVGAALAHGLTDQGLGVTLLDEGDVAFRASRGNFGLTWIQGKGDGFPAYARLSRQAAALWPGFAAALEDQTGVALGFRQPGGFLLCLGEHELEERRRLINRMHNQHRGDRYPAEMLGGDEVRRRLPAAGPAVTGASFCPEDGQVDPLHLLAALLRAGQDRGMRYLANRRVDTITGDGAGFSVRAAGETFGAARLVLAAGLDNRRLAPMVGLEAPVRPVQGQVLVTQRLPRLLDHPTLTIRQTEEGTIMLGDSHEEVGFDVTTSTRVIGGIARRAVRIFPCLARAQVVRAWAALRIMPPDGCPIYQQSKTMPGAFVTSCHSGVTLAPVHALRLAPAIAGGQLAGDLSVFSTDRFHVPAAS